MTAFELTKTEYVEWDGVRYAVYDWVDIGHIHDGKLYEAFLALVESEDINWDTQFIFVNRKDIDRWNITHLRTTRDLSKRQNFDYPTWIRWKARAHYDMFLKGI